MKPLIITVLIFCGLSLSEGLRFQIFRSNHLRGLIYDFEGDATECENLPSYAVGQAGSVRTDRCVMVYANSNCAGFSIRLDPNLEGHRTTNAMISSFRHCNGEIGGKQIHVKMMKKDGSTIADYQDICGCQELPSEVTVDLSKLDNHGNCITVYSSTDCSGDRNADIVAGQNANSEDLARVGFVIRSVAACGVTPACVRLQSNIFKFDLIFPEIDSGEGRNVELAAKTTFYNNGSATVTQTYSASKTVRESFTITRSQTYRTMQSSTVEKGVEVTAEAGFSGFGFSASVSVSTSLKEAMTFETSSESSVEESYTHEEEKTFAVTQEIQIPPCVEYQVNSMVTILEKVPIDYWIYTRVTGESSGVKMTATELEGFVQELEFVNAYDDHTAIFRSRHTLFANVGVDTWITGEGIDIEVCQSGSGIARETHYEQLARRYGIK